MRRLNSNSLIATYLAPLRVFEFDNRVLNGESEVFGEWEGARDEEVTLEVTPGPLDIMEIRRVFRQSLDDQPGLYGDRPTGEPAGVHRAVVEHQHDRPDRTPRF